MPKIDIAAVPERKGSGYPPPFDTPCAERVRQRLGNAGGLGDFGVNLMRLPPGNWSSQRHWHSHEDEFVYVLEGELILIEDGGDAPKLPFRQPASKWACRPCAQTFRRCWRFSCRRRSRW